MSTVGSSGLLLVVAADSPNQDIGPFLAQRRGKLRPMATSSKIEKWAATVKTAGIQPQ